MTGAPTYPLRDEESRLVGVVTRHEGTNQKYKYPYNVSTSRTLFGTRAPASVVILVEGATDVMALEQAGYPEQWNVVGCYGAGVHYPQLSLIAAMNPEVILTAFDSDPAGGMADERARPVLEEIAPVLSHPWSTFGAKDAAELDPPIRLESIRLTLHQAGLQRLA